MPRLPRTIDFNDQDYPELAQIFRDIDIGVAAIVAADPALRPKAAIQRRPRGSRPDAVVSRAKSARRRAA